jgi:hypothetical protein
MTLFPATPTHDDTEVALSNDQSRNAIHLKRTAQASKATHQAKRFARTEGGMKERPDGRVKFDQQTKRYCERR